jgi:mitochondrial fission protein ELM1
MTSDKTTDPVAQRPLEGAACWIISDGKAGHEAQCLGVAEALGVDAVMKRVTPRGIWKTLSPWAPVAPAERFGSPESAFAPPWPTLALAIGRLTTPYIRRLKQVAGLKTFTVILLDPKTGLKTADMFWLPEHDRRRGPNVVTTLTAPHRFSPDRLNELRAEVPPDIAALSWPRVAVFIGGPNGDYDFTPEDVSRLVGSLQAMGKQGAGLMISCSRRTPPEIARAIESATRDIPRIYWNGTGENPYASFLAHADMFVVTADSVNMTGEPCVTGKPVYVFFPKGGSPKFSRFHRALTHYGATRPLPEKPDLADVWNYPPLYSATTIAEHIGQRWLRRRQMLSGIVSSAPGP